MSEYDETWKAIKEAVSIAKSSDCECDWDLVECVPCRKWGEVQQAIPGLEKAQQERDEARREADEAGWDRAILHFADTFDITKG